MNARIKEISEELRLFISEKTFDALLPPLLFAVVNGRYQLTVASILAIALALLLGIIRLARKQPLRYAVGGLVGFRLVLAQGREACLSGSDGSLVSVFSDALGLDQYALGASVTSMDQAWRNTGKENCRHVVFSLMGFGKKAF